MGLGLIQVYSASYIYAIEHYGTGLYFFKKQLVFSLLGLLTFTFFAHINLNIIKKSTWFVWIGVTLLISFTFIPEIGLTVGGASRWINLPFGLRFEPSELLKIAVSLIFAHLLFVSTYNKSLLKAVFIGISFCTPFILLLFQPDFGTFAILLFVVGILLFAFGLKWRYILTGVLALIPLFYFLIFSLPYRKARILGFLDPWADPNQKGFQVIQSLLSFYSGGIKGVGLGNSQGKLFFLPEAHTDFTLSIMGEELGFIGIFFLLILFGYIIFLGFKTAFNCKDSYFKALALGLTLTFGISVFVNFGVALGILPTKGLVLPFLSYGGSSLICNCILMGILLNINRHTKLNYKKA